MLIMIKVTNGFKTYNNTIIPITNKFWSKTRLEIKKRSKYCCFLNNIC